MQEIMIHGSEYRGLVEKHNVHGPPYGPVSSTVLMEGFPESMLGVRKSTASHFFNLLPLNRSVVEDDLLLSSGTRAFQEQPLDDDRQTGKGMARVRSGSGSCDKVGD